MAAKLYYQEDCNLSVLEGQTIAISDMEVRDTHMH